MQDNVDVLDDLLDERASPLGWESSHGKIDTTIVDEHFQPFYTILYDDMKRERKSSFTRVFTAPEIRSCAGTALSGIAR